MAVTIAPIGGLNGQLRVIRDADCDNTAEIDVADGACTVQLVVIDNSANAAISYLKMYNNAAPTVGTDPPHMILPAVASDRMTYYFEGGVPFSTCLTLACVTAGGTAGTTSPTSNVIVTVVVE